jgi:FixJ family two-component response regulator
MEGAIAATDDRPRIFVVDDDAGVRESFLRQVRREGWDAEGFATAREFLRRAHFGGLGCALLEARLPDLTGSELHAKMISRGVNLPVIFVSAFGDVPTAVAAIRRGAVDFLVKPVEPETLLATIRQALVRHAAVRHSEARRQGLEERLESLSPRQREVLQLLLTGRFNKQVAQLLGITTKTVKAHRGAVMRKMGFKSLLQIPGGIGREVGGVSTGGE